MEGDSSILETAPSSDGLFDISHANGSRSAKKPRISGTENELDNLFLDSSFDAGNDLPAVDMDDEMDTTIPTTKKEEDEDDDMVVVKAIKKTKPAGAKRQLVNSTSTKVLRPVAKIEEEEVDVKASIKDMKSAQDSKKPKGMDWQLAAAAVTLEGDADNDDVEMADEDIFTAPAKPKKFKAPSAGGGSLKTAKVQALEEDGSIRFYWLDYVETNGVLHFIGKVFDRETEKYVSCALTVEGIDRNLFVLPRQAGVDGKWQLRETQSTRSFRINAKFTDFGNETEAPTEDEVYEEFGRIAEKAGITEWMGKQVERKYAFELPDIPQETNYLKVLYSFDRECGPC
jgi:DNA polymerase alpha subunit A